MWVGLWSLESSNSILYAPFTYFFYDITSILDNSFYSELRVDFNFEFSPFSFKLLMCMQILGST